MKQKIDRLTLKQLAAESASDERSVAKRLRGEPVRGLAGARIDSVLEKRGFAESAGDDGDSA